MTRSSAADLVDGFLGFGFPFDFEGPFDLCRVALLERRGEGDFGSRRRFFAFGDAVYFVFDAFRAGFLAAGPAGAELDDPGHVLCAFFQRFEDGFVEDDRFEFFRPGRVFDFFFSDFDFFFFLLAQELRGEHEHVSAGPGGDLLVQTADSGSTTHAFSLAVFPSEMAPPVHPISSPVSPDIATMPSRASKPYPTDSSFTSVGPNTVPSGDDDSLPPSG